MSLFIPEPNWLEVLASEMTGNLAGRVALLEQQAAYRAQRDAQMQLAQLLNNRDREAKA